MGKMDVTVISLTVPSVTLGSTIYTNSLPFKRTIGYSAVLLSSTAGQITVSAQCSVNNKEWYDPVDASGNPLGKIVSGQLVTTGRWIEFTPPLAPYIRLKIVEANVAATTVTISFLFQEGL